MNISNFNRSLNQFEQLNRQGGNATILFFLMILALFSLFTLGVEGGRYLRTESRLSDAAEIASLLMTATNSDNQTTNQAIVNDIVSAYMPDDISATSTVIRETCKEGECGINVKSHGDFVRYQVTATSVHNSWLPKTSDTVGFTPQVSITSSASALKLNSGKADIAFVLNIGNNMSDEEYQQATDIINQYADTLQSNNEQDVTNLQQIAVVPFNERTRDAHDAFTNKGTSADPFYEVCDREELVLLPGKQFTNKGPGKISNQVADVDFPKTINSILDEDNKKHCYDDAALLSRRFHNIDLTADPEGDNLTGILATFQRGSNETAPYEGLIRAAQIISQGEQARRYIVMLTDGMRGYEEIFIKLVETHGLCDNIRSEVNQSTASDGSPVDLKIVLVKVGNEVLFSTEKTLVKYYSQCVDKEIFMTEAAMASAPLPGKELYQRLMREEIGHIITKK